MKQNLKSRQPLIPEFFLERVLKGGVRVGRVPNSSCQPDFSPNPSYQICNPISSACLLTDAHHEVKALIDAIWIMNLHSRSSKLLILLVNTLPLLTLVDTTILKPPVFCTILIRITVFTLLFSLLL